jgi:hypothetical protein
MTIPMGIEKYQDSVTKHHAPFSSRLLRQIARQSPMTPSPRGLIRRVLSPAIALWLRSQVEAVEHLQVAVNAGDRDLLSGQIPEVKLQAKAVVYQGMHLSEIDITAQNILVDLPQVLKGKAFQLKESIDITAQVNLTTEALNASLGAPLLEGVIREFLADLLRSVGMDSANLNLQNFAVQPGEGQLRLLADLLAPTGQSQRIALSTRMTLPEPNRLALSQAQWFLSAKSKRGMPLADLEGYSFDLGPDTAIEAMTITAEGLAIAGQFKAYP